MKKANFIDDLMASLVNKIFDEMNEKPIDRRWYSPCEFTQLKTKINRDPNWINSHRIGGIINNIGITYGLPPGVLVDHLRMKQNRNHPTSYPGR